ncbi:hypothetical protein LX81_03023 [Palleronia aestuarii]|uniref:Uncharacterized protein n=2 Tax=Palleronia aestuarii TaxID=568105 RepID=A0A2W7NBX3_9RHOB|nr:hypothetical protein LX81_03023 [Palleronia aestuarii]
MVKKTDNPNSLNSIKAKKVETVPSAQNWVAATIDAHGLDPTSDPLTEGVIRLASFIVGFNTPFPKQRRVDLERWAIAD